MSDQKIDIYELAGKQIFELKMLETVNSKDLGLPPGFAILRVPGGFVFMSGSGCCFVPEPNKPIPSAEMLFTTPGDPAEPETTNDPDYLKWVAKPKTNCMIDPRTKRPFKQTREITKPKTIKKRIKKNAISK